jgi:hypothetical protein
MSQLKLTSWQRRRLRRQLREATDVSLYRRTLAVLEFDHGRAAADIARMLGVTRQSVYNWIEAYSQGCDPSALANASGRDHIASMGYPAFRGSVRSYMTMLPATATFMLYSPGSSGTFPSPALSSRDPRHRAGRRSVQGERSVQAVLLCGPVPRRSSGSCTVLLCGPVPRRSSGSCQGRHVGVHGGSHSASPK